MSEYTNADFEVFKERLRMILPGKRFEHSVRVGETAVRLADYWNSDIEKAQIAGLLHDIGRCLDSEEMIAAAEKMGIEVSPIMRRRKGLLHGPAGAYLLGADWGIKDLEILDAVRYHTVPVFGMTKLAKIVVIADMTEPARSFLGVEEIREWSYISLSAAMAGVIYRKLCYVKETDDSVMPGTEEAYRLYKNEAKEEGFNFE